MITDSMMKKAPLCWRQLQDMSRRLARAILREQKWDVAVGGAEINGYLKAMETQGIVTEAERQEFYKFFRRELPEEMIRQGAAL